MEVNIDDINPKFKIGPKDKLYNHWIVEVTPEIRKRMLDAGRVYIGWASCYVKDHVRVLRCFKCQKFSDVPVTSPSDSDSATNIALKVHVIRRYHTTFPALMPDHSDPQRRQRTSQR